MRLLAYASTSFSAAPVAVSEGATTPVHVILCGSAVQTVSYADKDPDAEDAELARAAMAAPRGKNWSVVKRSLGL